MYVQHQQRRRLATRVISCLLNFLRMFRGSLVRTLSCPLRSLFQREGCAAPCCGQSAAKRTVQESSSEVIQNWNEASSILTKTLPCLTQLPLLCSEDEGHSSLRHPRCKDFSQNTVIVSPLLQSQRMPACQTLFRSTAKTFRKAFLLRHFSSCQDQRWVLNQPLSNSQLSSVYLSQTRALYHTAPREAVAWRDCLSPENESRCRQRLGANLKLYETDRKQKRGWIGSTAKSQGRWASVLVSLCSVDGEPAFLFTLRSSMLKGRHKGDVSFAGGKSDPSDSDVVATALREAREELGVNVTTDSVWGILKPLRDWSGMMIAPVLANLGPIEELTFKPNPGEVEEIFTLSVSHLCNPQNCGYTHFRTGNKYGYTLPVFRNGKHRVWGLTAVALDHTLKLIVPENRSH